MAIISGVRESSSGSGKCNFSKSFAQMSWMDALVWLLSRILTAGAVLLWFWSQSNCASSPLVNSTWLVGSISVGIAAGLTRFSLVGSIGAWPCLAVMMM